MSYAKQSGSAGSDTLLPLRLTLTPQLARWVSLASTQNLVPVLRELSVELSGAVAATALEFKISANPPFIYPVTIRLDRLDPTGPRTLDVSTLHPDHSFLAGLTEAMEGYLVIEASAQGCEKVTYTAPLRLLPADQWEGLSDIPELLTAHVQPNHPVVGQILSTAGALLKSQQLSLSGYQQGSREVVARQVAAIYSAIRQRDFAYVNPPANFHEKGQRLRLPDQIQRERLATCLDLSVLFAACLEQAGLHPLILMSDGHAWAGCWLDEGSSCASPVDDDGQTLRKRLAIGELLAIEVTTLTNKTSLFADAQKIGREHTEDEARFEAAVDIRLARQSGIRPIPMRVNGQFEVPQETSPKPDSIDSVSVIDGSVPKGADPEVEPLNRRLERWKRKLLDLTLRNRLVNFKPTAKSLRIVGTKLGQLEDALAGQEAFGFDVNPRFENQKDPSTGKSLPAAVAIERLTALAETALGRKKLVTELDDKEKLITRLTEFFRNARSAEEESGVSPLYLALGILEWKETERSSAVNRAPIILVPVELDRSSVKAGLGGFTLLSRDEDTRINPTLLEKLRRDFGIAFDISDTPPVDDSGVDVPRILRDFRHLVIDRKGWEVKDEIWLGEFSFKKFLMWRDLQEREAVLRKHPLVLQMLEQPNTPIASQGAFPDARELDAKCAPSEVFTPLLADSSQLAAVQAASEGKSFVLEGPPGTGKSQTITNLISHCIAHGKTVLFVSEKKAALDVVRKRLDNVGLGTYCLEVHSDKARKTEIIDQLRAPLQPLKSPPRSQWQETTNALGVARQKLNVYVAALHQRYPCGLTIYEATGWLCGHPNARSIPLGWGDPNDWQLPPLSELRSLVAEMMPVLDQLGSLSKHPLVGSQLDDSSPVIERTVKEATEATRQALTVFIEDAGRVANRLGVTANDMSRPELDGLVEFSQSLISLDKCPAAVGSLIGQTGKLATLRACARLLQQRKEHCGVVEANFVPSICSADLGSLETLRRDASTAWWPRSWFRKRALSKRVQPFLRDKHSEQGAISALPGVIASVREIQRLDATLASHDAELTVALGDWWQGTQTSPELLLKAVATSEALQSQLTKLSRQNLGRMSILIEHARSLLELGLEEIRAGGPLGQELSSLLARNQAIHRTLRKLLNDLYLNAIPVADAAPEYLAKANRWVDAVRQALAADQLRFWTAWRRLRARGQSVGLSAMIEHREAIADDGSLLELFEASARQWLLEEGVSRSDTLKNFIGRSHNQLISEFGRLDNQYLELVNHAAAARVDARIPREGLEPGIDQEYALLHRELNKRSRHRPLRKLFAGMPGLMAKIKPCLLMSPLSVAQHLDADFPPFDLVVFDEASQIPVWDAIGAIARAKQAIIVGDPKQMPPTAFFTRDDTEDEDQPDVTEELESILDETMTTLPIRRLEWHYRSRYESLITFSNRHYYEGKLVTFPSPVAKDQAVRLHRVNGTYGRGTSRTNRKEAEEVVKFIVEHLRGAETKDASIGIVTFNIQQKKLIDDLLDAALREDPALEPHFAKGRGKEEVFVKNLENVQGDERDVIVFSTTFGPDELGKLSVNFGPINSASGPRRLNVAITRSRLAMHVFSSIAPERLDSTRTTAVGVRHLKEFLEYADRGVEALNQATTSFGDDPESPFEEAVASALRGKGWNVHHQIGCGGYRIDLAVVNPNAPGSYLAGVECDGASYHSAATARDRDRLRQAKLEELGWTLHRIWSTEWWRRPQEEIERIHSKLEQKLADMKRVASAQNRIS
jgi:very-short-patch-repair endonuclease